MNAVQCDYCGKFAPNPGARLRSYAGQALPADWFAVGTWPGGTPEGGADSRGEHGEFCSRDCISHFFATPPKEPAA